MAAAAVQVYIQYEHNGATITDVVQLLPDERLLLALQSFAARCSGLNPASAAGKVARHLYDFVYRDRLLDGTETARQLGMTDRDFIHTLPIHYWTREPERVLYTCQSSAACRIRRSLVTLFTNVRACPENHIPRCAASKLSTFDERLQLHLDEPRRIPDAIFNEYLDVARASNRHSTKRRRVQAAMDLYHVCRASEALAVADVVATHGRLGPSPFQPQDACAHGEDRLQDDLLREVHGIFASVAPAFLVGRSQASRPESTGRRPLALPAIQHVPEHAASSTIHAVGVADLDVPLCLRSAEGSRPEGRGLCAASNMAALWRCAREQEVLVARAEGYELKARRAALSERHAAFLADRAELRATREQRRLKSLLDSVARPLGGPWDAMLTDTWRAYERVRPMTPMRHWLVHGCLPCQGPSQGPCPGPCQGRCTLLEGEALIPQRPPSHPHPRPQLHSHLRLHPHPRPHSPSLRAARGGASHRSRARGDTCGTRPAEGRGMAARRPHHGIPHPPPTGSTQQHMSSAAREHTH